MFNFSEIIFISVLAFVLIGPKQLPIVARTLGRFLNEFRRASEGFLGEMRSPTTSKSFASELQKDLMESVTSKANKSGSDNPTSRDDKSDSHS